MITLFTNWEGLYWDAMLQFLCVLHKRKLLFMIEQNVMPSVFMFSYHRKSSMPKIMSVVNGIYKSEKPEDDKLYLHEVTEYSEIPDSEVRLFFFSSLL